MAHPPRDQANEATPGEQQHGQQRRTQEELPVLGDAAEGVFEQHEQAGADHRAEQPRDPAQDDEHHNLARQVPGHHRRTDEAVEIGIERAGEAGDHAGYHEGRELDPVGRQAECGDASLVLADRLQCHAEARTGHLPLCQQHHDQHRVAEQEEIERTKRVETREGITDIDRQAILAAIGRPGNGEIVDHLREGQRDHDEVDAGRAQAQRPYHQRRKPADQNRDQPQHQHLVGAVDDERRRQQRLVGLVVAGENAHGITANTEKCRVAE